MYLQCGSRTVVYGRIVSPSDVSVAVVLLRVACSPVRQILGVPKSASVKEIKQAYRRLALELHPDKLGANATADDEAKFIEVCVWVGL